MVGRGPVRTGVTVIVPHDRIGSEPVFAGCHRLNGNGELTGLEWVRESGQLTTPVAITNTHSVGVVRDALIAAEMRERAEATAYWSLPVVGETYDGALSDINGMHVRPEHVFAALDGAAGGPVPEGNVGGGTGMICHGFKAGIGTASRVVETDSGRFTVGALVQANYGAKEALRVEGVPVGRELVQQAAERPTEEAPAEPGAGSIIVILATDAPLLPIQCRRLARRATVGLARAGGVGYNYSGDLFLAFATGNSVPIHPTGPLTLHMLPHAHLNPFFDAAAEAVEEAILNSLTAAETMTGIGGFTAPALPLDEVRAVMRRYRPAE